jgi:hypothetical protein
LRLERCIHICALSAIALVLTSAAISKFRSGGSLSWALALADLSIITASAILCSATVGGKLYTLPLHLVMTPGE